MKQNRKWVLAIILVLSSGVAFWGARPVYQELKIQRARWMIKDLHFTEYDTSSFSKIRTALQLAPYDLQVLRKACEIYGQLNFTLGYIQWASLLRHDEVTVADYGLYLDFLIQYQQSSLFRPYAARLATNVRPNEIKLVLSKYYMAIDNWSVARLLLKELYQADEKTAEICYLYGLSILQQGWDSERAQASQLLQESILSGERYYQEAVNLLIRHRLLNEAELEQVLTILRQDQPDIDQQLLAYQLEASRGASGEQEVMLQILETYQQAERTKKLAIGRWMNRNRQYKKTVDFISEAEAADNRKLFLVRVDAMAAANRWNELDALFKEQVPLNREIQELFRFRIAHELGKEHVADIFWDRSLDLAREKPVLLWYFSGYASRLSLSDRVESAYRALLPITAHKRSAYLALVELLDKTGQTPKLFELLSKMRQEYPNDDEVANDWAYCALLLDREMEAAGKIVTAAVNQSPEVFAYRITYGLYLLRIDRAAEALSLFEDISLPSLEDWLLEWRVVYLAILQQNQQMDRAAEVLATVPFNQLKQEEASLIGMMQ